MSVQPAKNERAPLIPLTPKEQIKKLEKEKYKKIINYSIVAGCFYLTGIIFGSMTSQFLHA